MRVGIITVAAVVVLTAYGAFFAGQYLTIKTRQPMETAKGCAYYDPISGAFTWGAAPITMGSLIDEGLKGFGVAVPDQPPQPQRKPKHHD